VLLVTVNCFIFALHNSCHVHVENNTQLFAGGWEDSAQYYATIFMITIGTYIDIKMNRVIHKFCASMSHAALMHFRDVQQCRGGGVCRLLIC
jgi:hypothetical protein